VPLEHAEAVVAVGSPVRIGPEALARAALLTCAHYLPVGRAREVLEALTARYLARSTLRRTTHGGVRARSHLRKVCGQL
jgi:hypothetical protein